MCQHVSHYAVLEQHVWIIAEKNIRHVIGCVLTFSFFLDDACMMMMSSLVPVQFSFFPFISLLYASIFAFPMKKKPNQPLIMNFID